MQNRPSILGTGSFGHTFVPMTLEKSDPKRLVILSRDKMKSLDMAKIYGGDLPRPRLPRRRARQGPVGRALNGIDYVVHAVATRIVPTAEYNPFDGIKTNVLGAMNLIVASIARCVALSTDRASSPLNLYGATKRASDTLFVAAWVVKSTAKIGKI